MNKIIELLGKHEVCSALSLEELTSLSSIVQRHTYGEGEVVFDINKRPNYLFFIESGSFTLHLSSNKYKTLKPGELFGEIGVISGDFRSGSVTAAAQSSVISICGTRLFQEEFVSPVVTLKIVRALSKRIINYLRSNEQISTKEIIEQGERHDVEFKSTLRWNMYTKKKEKAIENASLKTLVAFMNSNGGSLIIGVADDGTLLGLANDQFSNNDKMLLHLTTLTKKRISPLHLKFLRFSVEKISEKEVFRIDCKPATLPAYLKDDNQEYFFIRTGPSTTNLKLSEVYAFIKGRFD